MTYPEADPQYATALAENAKLRAEVTFLTGLTLSQQQVDNALRLLPENLEDRA